MHSEFLRAGRSPPGPHEGGDGGMDLVGLVDPDRERDATVAGAIGLGDRRDESVAIDSVEGRLRRQPTTTQRLGEQQQLVAETVGHLGREF